VAGLAENLKQCPGLKYIVHCPRPDAPSASTASVSTSTALKKKVKAQGAVLMERQERVAQGRRGREPSEANQPRAADVSCICYTSGTEGETKGVILTHANLVASASNVCMMVGGATRVRESDCVFSFLPLAHIQQRCVELAAFARGASVGYLFGKTADMFPDMQALKPTIFVTVPRILNQLHRDVYKEQGRFRRSVLNAFMWIKKKQGQDKQQNHYVTRDSFADKLLLKKQQKALGGEIRLIITGSAPVQPEVVKHLRLLYGCVVLQGFGTTETSGAATMTNEADLAADHVGAPVPAAAVKLINIPDMGISAIDDKGEVLVSGPIVATQYLRSAVNGRLQTQPTVDPQGWFHTGDVGEWSDSGCLRIVDRVKNIFKLPQGVFVAPEKLESAYRMCKYMDQIFVTGDPLKPSLVAVGVPDMEMMAMCAKEDFGLDLKLEDSELSQADRVLLCKNPKVRAVVLDELQKAGKAFGLMAYEMVKGIHLRPERFSAENGLLTATDHKLRRHELRRRFKLDIDRLFLEIQTNAAANTVNKSATQPPPRKSPNKRSDLL
jgi:long-chain acyl-CoA synthetase